MRSFLQSNFEVFVLVAQFVLMNVVIAVLMKQLEDANNEVNSDISSGMFEKLYFLSLYYSYSIRLIIWIRNGELILKT